MKYAYMVVVEYPSRGGIKRVFLAKRGKTDPAIFPTRRAADRFLDKTGLKTYPEVKYKIIEEWIHEEKA